MHFHVKNVVVWPAAATKGTNLIVLERNFDISLKEILPLDAFSRQKSDQLATF
jgi:hypothetical protein